MTTVEPVCLWPPGGPATIKTCIGWTLQGPVQEIRHGLTEQQCIFTVTQYPTADLHSQAERLWQMDVLHWQNEKTSARSHQDQDAVAFLEAKTVKVEVDRVQRFATPLLCGKNMPQLRAPKEAVLPQLRGIEKKVCKTPAQALAYRSEIQKLAPSGYVVKLAPGVEVAKTFVGMCHTMWCNIFGKNCVVFNCSFQSRGHKLNELLLSGPTLSP